MLLYFKLRVCKWGTALLEAESQLTTPLIANLVIIKSEVGEVGAGVLPQRLGQITTPLCANLVRSKVELGEVGELAQDSVECIPFHPKDMDLDVIQLLETPLQHRARPLSP